MGFSVDADQGITDYFWPGNVRELLNVVERTALVYTGAGTVSFRDLSIPATQRVGTDGPKLELVPTLSTEEGYMRLKKRWSSSFEREYLGSLLSKAGGNVSAAAREAKLDRSNFLRLLRRHGLRAQEFRPSQKIAA
jgi:transcriptional regulator with GAF, ATPase, and Fis domain